MLLKSFGLAFQKFQLRKSLNGLLNRLFETLGLGLSTQLLRLRSEHPVSPGLISHLVEVKCVNLDLAIRCPDLTQMLPFAML